MKHGYRPFYGQGDNPYETTAAPTSVEDRLFAEWPDPPPGAACDASDSVTALRRVCDYVEASRQRTFDWKVELNGWVVRVGAAKAQMIAMADEAARRSDPLAGEFALQVMHWPSGRIIVRATGDSWTDLTRRVLGRLAALDAVSAP